MFYAIDWCLIFIKIYVEYFTNVFPLIFISSSKKIPLMCGCYSKLRFQFLEYILNEQLFLKNLLKPLRPGLK